MNPNLSVLVLIKIQLQRIFVSVPGLQSQGHFGLLGGAGKKRGRLRLYNNQKSMNAFKIPTNKIKLTVHEL